MFYQDKVVWITGASSGIGEALAYEFSREGARLILSSNEPDELRRVKAELKRPDEDVRVLELDLVNVDGLAAKAREALAWFGRVDVLVNNAGISHRSFAKDTSLDTIKKLMTIDYLAPVALTQAVLPGMIERKQGHVVITSSVAGKIGAPLRAGYCGAKHALHGYFDTLRAETWKDNIKVTIACPTAVRTKISLNALDARGEKYGIMSDHLEQGLTAEAAAKVYFDAIKKGKEEIIVGFDSLRLAVYLKRFVPGTFSKILRKAKIN